jgi:hypothetical protein
MKLAAIYSVWDSEELLIGSIRCSMGSVDEIIIVYQTVSNYGEKHDPITALLNDNANFFDSQKIHIIHYAPRLNESPKTNEVAKRNLGLMYAKIKNCTHFLHLDCDEYYQDFGEAKRLYMESGHAGSVCRLHTYFKKPTLRLDRPEDYYVPFIHELRPDTTAGVKNYPFYVDPTRRINETDVVELPNYMHHYSFVRKDIGRKVRNSTARKTLQNKHYIDYQRDLKAGDYLPCYDRKLIEVEDYFGIEKMI